MATSMGPAKTTATASSGIPTNYGALSTLIVVFFLFNFTTIIIAVVVINCHYTMSGFLICLPISTI